MKIIKIRILRGYVSKAYPTRIRIRYVSDTRYAALVAYPCYGGVSCSKETIPTELEKILFDIIKRIARV